MDAVRQLTTKVDGMNIKERDEEHRSRCEVCIQGKQHRKESEQRPNLIRTGREQSMTKHED